MGGKENILRVLMFVQDILYYIKFDTSSLSRELEILIAEHATFVTIVWFTTDFPLDCVIPKLEINAPIYFPDSQSLYRCPLKILHLCLFVWSQTNFPQLVSHNKLSFSSDSGSQAHLQSTPRMWKFSSIIALWMLFFVECWFCNLLDNIFNIFPAIITWSIGQWNDCYFFMTLLTKIGRDAVSFVESIMGGLEV